MADYSQQLESARLSEAALSRAKKAKLTTELAKTSYWTYPAKRADAQTIIFIHGYRGNHHGLEAIAGALSDFNVVIPDLPGFGESEPFADEHTVERYANWVGQFIEAQVLTAKPHLLGHSFGSIITSCFAANSSAIESLLLINPVSAPALKGPRQVLTRLTQGFYWSAKALPLKLGLALLKSSLVVRGMSVVMAKTRVRALRRWIHLQHDRNFSSFAEIRVATEGFDASISRNVGDYASEISVPTLMVIGERDDITSVAQQEATAAKFARATLFELPGVGHLSHYEAPSQTAECIRSFIADLKA